MKVERHSIGDIFGKCQRLEAPLFQRPYVWTEERNWTPLWEAIEEVANRRLCTGERPRSRFLGTIVVVNADHAMGRVESRELIDGQQRLTTLQLALAAARDCCEGAGDVAYAKHFRSLTENSLRGWTWTPTGSKSGRPTPTARTLPA